MKKYILLQLFIAVAIPFFAQSMPVQEERRFNLKVFQMLNTYERSINNAQSDLSVNEFEYLFQSPDLPIYNDLMGLSNERKVTVAKYMELLKDVKATRIVLKNVKKGSVKSNGNNWTMTITFDKYVQYIDRDGIWLDALDYHGEPYKMEAQFTYYPNGNCLITNLDGLSKSVFPSDYCAIQQNKENEKREVRVKFGNKPLIYNQYGQFIFDKSKIDDLIYSDPDVRMKILPKNNNEGCRLSELTFHPKRFRLKPYAEFSLGHFYQPKNFVNTNMSHSSSEVAFGLDMGVMFPSQSKLHAGIFIGAALAKQQLELTVDNLDYYYNAEGKADEDGDSYQRHYQLTNVRQQIKSTSIILPLYFDFDFAPSRYFSVYADLGAKCYIPVKNDLQSLMESRAWGVYPSYDNLVINNNINGFVSTTIGTDQLQTKKSKMQMVFDPFVGLGVRALLYKNIHADLSIQYQLGLQKSMQQLGQKVKVTDGNLTEAASLVTYTVRDGERVKSMMSHYSTIRHNCLKLKAGLIFKL